METLFGVAVQSAPEQLVSRENKYAHDRDAAYDHCSVSFIRHFGDVGPQPFRLQCGVSPSCKFCNDAGVPRTSGRSAGAGDPKRKNRRQNQRTPKRPAAETVRGGGFLQITWDG